jgi:LuxR family transcriptional regulator, maltose regulon positive regulatory protein
MLRALAHHANGEAEPAATDLSAALAEGVPAGYRRLFLDEGQPMVALLGQIARAGPHDAQTHAQQLLAAAQRTPAPAPAVRATDDELSERERDVLRLLATELSGPEIAGHLYISLNTLRTHTKHIFQKLDVNTRRAAVPRAAEPSLL